MYLQFRFVADNDFAKKMTWPELVPAFKTAIQNSDLVNSTGASELKTLNVLMGLQTIIKPYKVALLPYRQQWIYYLALLVFYLFFLLEFIYIYFMVLKIIAFAPCSILWTQQSLENLYRNSWSLFQKSYLRPCMAYSIILSSRYLDCLYLL